MQHSNTAGCILLKFYIKPQHTANVYNLLYVVSYRNSTSNHNLGLSSYCLQIVVSYRNSTFDKHSSVLLTFDYSNKGYAIFFWVPAKHLAREEAENISPTSRGRTTLSKRVSTNRSRNSSPFTFLVSCVFPFL